MKVSGATDPCTRSDIILTVMTPSVLSSQVAYRVASSLTDVVIDTHRRKHLAYLMADQGALLNPESTRNLPKQVRNEINL